MEEVGTIGHMEAAREVGRTLPFRSMCKEAAKDGGNMLRVRLRVEDNCV